MESIWFPILTSLITGATSSGLVVLYFESRRKRQYSLSRAHLLQRYIQNLFLILTVIRSAAKLPPPTGKDQLAVAKDLEQILGRFNPAIFMSCVTNISLSDYERIFNELSLIQSSLATLFSDSVAHQTLEGSVSASIAETQDWINAVLQIYIIFPEIQSGHDEVLQSRWIADMFNLVENTLSALMRTIELQSATEGALRWGSRSK